MGKQSGKRARTSAKAKDLGRIETWRAARVKGGLLNLNQRGGKP